MAEVQMADSRLQKYRLKIADGKSTDGRLQIAEKAKTPGPLDHRYCNLKSAIWKLGKLADGRLQKKLRHQGLWTTDTAI